MNERLSQARRYHWLAGAVEDFVCEPHAAIQDLGSESVARHNPPAPEQLTLNLVAAEGEANRRASAELVRDHPEELLQIIRSQKEGPTLFAPAHHPVLPSDVNLDRLERSILLAREKHPADFEALLGSGGVGPATMRSLALIAELIYGAPVSRRDPSPPKKREELAVESPPKWADYSYAHGGKDGYPFPVDRATYDRNIQILTDAVRKARLGEPDKTDAFKRLARLSSS
jgi:hypothetical protein